VTRTRWWAAAAAVGLVLVAAACTTSNDTGSGTGTTDGAPTTVGSGGDPGDCIPVELAVSPEKITLLTDLARTFNEQAQEVEGRCVFVRTLRKSSGAAASLLTEGWPSPETNGPQPVIWSPAASGWGGVVNQRLADRGEQAIASASKPFMLTPLVIAMPQPMAEALGYPQKPVGFKDIAELATDPQGWARFDHPEWGPFRLGKTNPNFSTSGLNFTVAEYYAATGKTRGLTQEDLARPDVEQFATDVESAVVHYGDTTLTFLNNLYRADTRGTALTYASAVAIEEKSLLDYNSGNPDGELAPGEVPRPPKVPLVAIYPTEGTLFSDNPLIILDAPWVSAEQKQAAELFRDYVLLPENQERVLQFGFRPGNPQVAVGAPIVVENGVDPSQPQAVLEVPEPPVLVEVLDKWAEQRKRARVLLVVDVSGSMGEEATPGSVTTKLELAKQAAIASLGQFKDDDEVGLRIFTTEITGEPGVDYLDLVPVAPIGPQRDELASRIENLVPVNGTPLYQVTQDSYDAMRQAYDPARINAVVLLTDGRNEDGEAADDEAQLEQLLESVRGGSEGATSEPVRIFAIAYGEDADLAVLRRIADASNAVAYDASDPTTINQVFAAVVSNF
jgi:Ca-activated chloride channel family protein